LGIIAGVVWLVWLHLTHSIAIAGAGFWGLVAYLAPIAIGAIFIFFLVKPLFAPSSETRGTRSLTRESEPVLFAFVDRICQAVGSPQPSRIDVDCEVNASASFRRGLLSMFGDDLVLTIGVPLVAGLSARQFAGVLAHEFGHFSQGAGMRLSYLIRRINAWFQRVVYQRDQWDEWLRDTAGEMDFRIGFIFYLTMLLVWITRRLLLGLMMAGHFVGSFFMRQMEYDADRYEARLSGSDTFAATQKRVMTLGIAHQGAMHDLGNFYREKRLSDDIPKLILANLRQVTAAKHKAKLDEYLDKEESHWYDSHPSSKQRIASALREQAPGVFRLDAPATALFSNFTALSKNVTYDVYREMFGQKFDRSAMHNTDELLARLGRDDENLEAVGRYGQGVFTMLRALPLPLATPDVPEQPKAMLAGVKLQRERLLAGAAAHREMLLEYDRADTNLVECKQVLELLHAHQRVKAADFKVPTASTSHALRARTEAETTQGRLNDKLRVCETALAERLHAALCLLHVPQVAQRVADAQNLQQQSRDLYEWVVQVSAYVKSILQLRTERAGFEILLSRLESRQPPEALIDSIFRSMREVHRLLAELRGELFRIPYPFDHAQGSITLAYFCLENMPLSDDLPAIHRGSGEFLDALSHVYQRAIGHLFAAAEQVETAVGLPKLKAVESEA
jgi:hypothetical protein